MKKKSHVYMTKGNYFAMLPLCNEIVNMKHILFMLLALGVGGAPGNLTLNKYGGYENLLVWVKDGVPYHKDFLDNLKAHFIEASKVLYTATEHNEGHTPGSKRYFAELTVIVPSGWTEATECASLTTEDRSRAQFHVAPETRQMGPLLRTTVLHRECGKEQAGPIDIPDTYITKPNQAKNIFGRPGVALIHEFALLRYGLHKESNEYQNNCEIQGGDFVAVACSEAVSGIFQPDPRNSWCQFKHHDKLSENAVASLMFYGIPFLPSVETFCDEQHGEANPRDGTTHKVGVIHDHNDNCDGSAWGVLRKHPDFSPGNLGIGHMPNLDDIAFTCLRQDKMLRLVLVMDVSGSMGSQNRLTRMRVDVKVFLENLYNSGDDMEVGMIEFSTTSTILINMTPLKTEGDLKNLIDAIPDSSGGSTCIGCGIEDALNILSAGGSAAGGKVYVFTDGGESTNLKPTISDVENDVLTSDVTIYGLLVDFVSEDHALNILAEKSGGESCIYSDVDGQDYYDCLENIHKRFSDNLPFEIKVEELFLPPRQSKQETVMVDSSFNNHLRFTLMWTDTALILENEAELSSKSNIHDEMIVNMLKDFTPENRAACDLLDLKVTSPDGVVLDRSHPGYEKSIEFQTITITSNDHAPGVWDYDVINNGLTACNVKLRIEGFSSSNSSCNDDMEKPLNMESKISASKIDFSTQTDPSKMTISMYAHVRKGNAPVVSADVKAKFILDALTWEVSLLDNGVGTDFHKDDGVYSGQVIQFPQDGTYTVIFYAKSIENVTEILQESRIVEVEGDGNNTQFTILRNETRVRYDLFERSINAGNIEVLNVPADVDVIIPPGKINNLRVTENVWNETITMTWTATGSSLEDGTSDRYDMRISKSHLELRENFTDCFNITEELLINGTLLAPKPSGEREHIIISQQKFTEQMLNGTYYVALKALDSHDNVGELSNILVVHVTPPPTPAPPAPTPAPTPPPSDIPDAPPSSMFMYVLFITLSASVVVTSLISGMIIARERSHRIAPAVENRVV